MMNGSDIKQHDAAPCAVGSELASTFREMCDQQPLNRIGREGFKIATDRPVSEASPGEQAYLGGYAQASEEMYQGFADAVATERSGGNQVGGGISPADLPKLNGYCYGDVFPSEPKASGRLANVKDMIV